MWMIVSEDAPGRVHFNCRDLSRSSWRKPQTYSPVTSTRQPFSRGCPRFPNTALLSPRRSPLCSSANFEDERYDNVTPEPQWPAGFSTRHGDRGRRSSVSTTSSEYQTPSPHGGPSAIYRSSSPMRGFYYYSQDDPTVYASGSARSYDAHTYSGNRTAPVSKGEYVTSRVSECIYSDVDLNGINRTQFLHRTSVPRRVSDGRKVTYAVPCTPSGRSTIGKKGKSVVIIPAPDYCDHPAADREKESRETTWRENWYGIGMFINPSCICTCFHFFDF